MLRRFLSSFVPTDNVQPLLGDFSALHIASQEGKYEAAEALIAKDPQLVNATNKYHQTPLHFAAWNGRCQIVSLLLSNGADVNSLARFTNDEPTTPPSVSALYLAAFNGSVECIRVLLEKGANISHQDRYGQTTLHIASQLGKYEAAKVLIKKNPQLVNATGKDHWYPIHYAAWKGRCGIIKLLLSNHADPNALARFTTDDSTIPPHVSALYWAAEDGHTECVKILLDNGADITHKTHEGATALHIASGQGHYEAAKVLIKKDPSLVNSTDEDHWYPLHYAALNGHCDIIKLLLSNHANPNALAKLSIDDSTTPPHVSALHLAVISGHAECVRLLLKKGANSSTKNNDGETPLHIASQFDRYEVVKLLVKKGADLTIKNNDGKTALQLATNKEIIDYLKKHQKLKT